MKFNQIVVLSLLAALPAPSIQQLDDGAILESIDSYIDHSSTGADPNAADHLRSPNRSDQNLCAPHLLGKIPSFGMTDGHRCSFGEKQLGDRFPDDVRSSHDHRMRSLQGDTGPSQEIDAPERSTGNKGGLADR